MVNGQPKEHCNALHAARQRLLKPRFHMRTEVRGHLWHAAQQGSPRSSRKHIVGFPPAYDSMTMTSELQAFTGYYYCSSSNMAVDLPQCWPFGLQRHPRLIDACACGRVVGCCNCRHHSLQGQSRWHTHTWRGKRSTQQVQKPAAGLPQNYKSFVKLKMIELLARFRKRTLIVGNSWLESTKRRALLLISYLSRPEHIIYVTARMQLLSYIITALRQLSWFTQVKAHDPHHIASETCPLSGAKDVFTRATATLQLCTPLV